MATPRCPLTTFLGFHGELQPLTNQPPLNTFPRKGTGLLTSIKSTTRVLDETIFGGGSRMGQMLVVGGGSIPQVTTNLTWKVMMMMWWKYKTTRSPFDVAGMFEMLQHFESWWTDWKSQVEFYQDLMCWLNFETISSQISGCQRDDCPFPPMSETAKYVFLYDLKREGILFQILNSKFGGAKFFFFLVGGSLLLASIGGPLRQWTGIILEKSMEKYEENWLKWEQYLVQYWIELMQCWYIKVPLVNTINTKHGMPNH